LQVEIKPMIGDKIVPKEHHTRAAEAIYRHLATQPTPFAISIAGESGAGKSEIAVELARLFEAEGKKTCIFHQDDYFFLPPKSNDRRRREDIGHVGMGEVDLALIDKHLELARDPATSALTRPLVVFDEDRIAEETIDPRGVDVFIVEGTYVTGLDHLDYRVFIDRTYEDTIAHRRERARDAIDEFSERVLEIEHEIVSKHKARANFVVAKDYSVTVIDR